MPAEPSGGGNTYILELVPAGRLGGSRTDGETKEDALARVVAEGLLAESSSAIVCSIGSELGRLTIHILAFNLAVPFSVYGTCVNIDPVSNPGTLGSGSRCRRSKGIARAP